MMARRKKYNDHGTGVPEHEMEALAVVLLPAIRAFFESEEGRQEYGAGYVIFYDERFMKLLEQF